MSFECESHCVKVCCDEVQMCIKEIDYQNNSSSCRFYDFAFFIVIGVVGLVLIVVIIVCIIRCRRKN